MMVHPRRGQLVQVWYKRAIAPFMPLHGKTGRVAVVARGKGPRKHGAIIDGQLWVVPCGNLRKIEDEVQHAQPG